MSIPTTRLLTLATTVTIEPGERTAEGRPLFSAWIRSAEQLRARAIRLATQQTIDLRASSCSMQIETPSNASEFTAFFAFTQLGETQWRTQTIFFSDHIETAIVDEHGGFTTEDGTLPTALRQAAMDWATDEAIYTFIRLNP